METAFDVIVIGAGAAGENAAAGAARAGLNVAIVESDLVGGECSYWACMPSKTLLSPGKALDEARRAPGAAEAVTGQLDIEAVLARRDAMVSNWDDEGQVDWLDSEGITLVRGHGRLAGERAVVVTDQQGTSTRYQASTAVVVATGSKTRHLAIEGLDEVGSWDSRDITSADQVPKRLLFIGGGAVGVEMAQAWAWLGSHVTIVQNSGRLLAGEEPEAGDELQRALEEMGITVLTNGDTSAVTRAPDGTVLADVYFPDGSRRLEVDEIVVTAGRVPRSDDVGVESVGLEPGRPLTVNDHMQVEGVEGGWLYAVGDVNGRALLTHQGKYQARIAGAHIGGSDAAASPIPAVPRVVFTNPEVAAVGLSEAKARDAGISVITLTHDIGHVAGASTLGKGYSGTVKLVLDAEREVIVGATFVGPRAGELLHAATIAIVGQVPLHALWHAVPSFPTLSEVWLRLLEHHRDAGWDPYG